MALPAEFYRNFTTAADMDGLIGYGVTIDATGIVSLAEQTDQLIGFIVDVVKTGVTGEVKVQLLAPVVLVKAGGAFDEGVDLTCDGTTDGEVITTSTSTHRVFGIALQAAADGDLVEVLPFAAHVLP